MKLQMMAAAAVALGGAGPSGATTILTGTLAPDSALQVDLPALEAGKIFSIDFLFSGGTPDGGEFYWQAREVRRYHELDGSLSSRDSEQEVGCSLAFDNALPTTCRGPTYAGSTFSATIRPDGFSARFGLPTNFDDCQPSGPAGVTCGAFYHTRTQGPLTFFFSGPEPTTYRLSYSLAAAVPEPATWALMLLGFGLCGAAIRKRASPADGACGLIPPRSAVLRRSS